MESYFVAVFQTFIGAIAIGGFCSFIWVSVAVFKI